MNHSPQSLLDLAREAAKWNKVFTMPPSDAERAWYRLVYEIEPALIIALCERLEEQFRGFRGCHTECECDLAADKRDAMTTPLLPAAPDAQHE